MNDTDLEHTLRETIRNQPVPQPTENLLAAIILRRQTDETVALPTEPFARPRTGMLYWVMSSAIAAALLLILVPLSNRAGHAAPASKTAGTGLFGVEALMAQATDHPTYPVIRSARELPPRQWRYAWSDSAEVDLTSAWRGERVAELFQSARTYRYAYSAWGNEGVLSDTAWFDQSGFLPIVRHAVTSNGTQITQEFKQNTVLTGWTAPTGYTQWASEEYNISTFKLVGDPKPRPAPRFIGPARQVGTWRLQMITGLEAAELGPDWHGSLEMISAPGGYWATRFWLNFQVTGEERVTVPAGTFDTWKVQVGEGDLFLLWVDKREGQIIQIGGPHRTMREVLLETELR